MAEREGFEPSMELLTPYSLSRGAPSAARPSLQKIFVAASYRQTIRGGGYQLGRPRPRVPLSKRHVKWPFTDFVDRASPTRPSLQKIFVAGSCRLTIHGGGYQLGRPRPRVPLSKRHVKWPFVDFVDRASPTRPSLQKIFVAGSCRSVTGNRKTQPDHRHWLMRRRHHPLA